MLAVRTFTGEMDYMVRTEHTASQAGCTAQDLRAPQRSDPHGAALPPAAAESQHDMVNGIISMVSHELRVPLMHIKGFASSLLQPDVHWDEETRLDFIRAIDREADRLARLVNDLLDISGLQKGSIRVHPVPVAPHVIVREGLERAASFLANHRVCVRAPSNLPRVMADVGRTEQVMVNLLENAAKYSPKDSLIVLRASRRRSEIEFSVADQGIGVAAEDHDRVFEKFTRVKHPGGPHTPGVGLGLALCKTIVEAHGGRIWLEGAPGCGAVFSFTLPLAHQAAMKTVSR